MQVTNNRFNAQDFCSRKLLQLVSAPDESSMTELDLRAAIDELSQRRHYLDKLEQMGALTPRD